MKTNKATGQDGIPTWILKGFSVILARPLAAMFNISLREGVLPDLWKSVNILPPPKVHPPKSLVMDLRPIVLSPVVAKMFESIVIKKFVNDKMSDIVDERQFGGVAGTSKTDALVEMLHECYKATDDRKTFVRVLLIDYRKDFDFINHNILINKLTNSGVSPHIVRWMAAFLLNHTQRVKLGDVCSLWSSPNGGVPQGTVSGPKDFVIHINDLHAPCPMYKYVDDCTLFEICNYDSSVGILQQSAKTLLAIGLFEMT